MKLNNTPDSKLNSFQILVSINIDRDSYCIGRLKFENTKQWEETRHKIEDDHFHPTDEFAELIKKRLPFADMDDIYRGYITLEFVDNAPVIEL